MIEAHVGQRQCGHDHHRAGRGYAADEREQREQAHIADQRDPEHVEVGVAAGLELHAGPEYDRDEQIHKQQKQGKRPRSGIDGSLVDVLRERHVKLPRQQERGAEGKQHQRRPWTFADRPIQRLQGLGMRVDPVIESAGAAEDAE